MENGIPIPVFFFIYWNRLRFPSPNASHDKSFLIISCHSFQYYCYENNKFQVVLLKRTTNNAI